MIQVLNSTLSTAFDGKDVVINTFHDAQSLDDFEINVIDLQDDYLWKNIGNSNANINSENDLKSLGIMLSTCNCKNIVILFPQNLIFEYYKAKGEYQHKLELKNMIFNMKDILSQLYKPISTLIWRYENTNTAVKDKMIKASFCFSGISQENILLASEKSRRPTVIKYMKAVISTLAIKGYVDMMSLLEEIGMLKKKTNIPEWMDGIKMFDDMKQLEEIQKNKDIIKESQDKIKTASKRIERNDRYKSVLYTSGDELVEVVFEIMQEMLGCDLHDFNDKKKEDFSFKREDIIYIGEIKGISSNVKSANITQLELHYRGFLDEQADIDENSIRQLLIIAHQRGIALSERDPVDKKQIELAERNGSLIIETYTLLKMFEKYQIQELTREQCFDLLDGKGLP